MSGTSVVRTVRLVVLVVVLMVVGLPATAQAETGTTVKPSPTTRQPAQTSVGKSDSDKSSNKNLDKRSTSLKTEGRGNESKAVAGVEEQLRVHTDGERSDQPESDLDCTTTPYVDNDLVQPIYEGTGDGVLDEETNEVRRNIIQQNAPGRDDKGRIDATTVEEFAFRPDSPRLYSPTGRWSWLSCIDDDGSLVFNLLPVGGPAVSLYDLLYQGLTEIDPPIHDVTINPAGKQLVQFPTLFWIEPAYWEADRSTTVGNGNVSLSLALVPYETEWDPGDGSDPVVCDGPGEVWERGLKGETFYCKHTYRSVEGQPFTITSTVRFRLEWETNSSEVLGPFAPLTRVDTVETGAREIQVVETNG